jgi:hypothetical protein
MPDSAPVKVVGLSTPADMPEGLIGYVIDEPFAGTERNTFVVHFVGWVIGRHSKVVTLEVMHGERLIRRAPVDRPRDDVVAAYPDAPHARDCGFQVLTGVLGLPREVELSLTAVLEDGSRVQIASVRLSHEPVGAALEPNLQPIIVTCLGRTGSTLLMKMLASHPEIVVLRRYPYESSAAKYWTHVLRVLSQPANWVQSTHPDTFSANIWAVGSHPFYDEGVAATPVLDEWIGGTYVKELAGFCQRSIDEWYARVGQSQSQESARYFAEKHMWPGYIPTLVRELYPKAKELFLVRDFRDMVQSILAFDAKRGYQGFRRRSEKTDEEYIRDDLRREVLDFCESWKSRAASSHLVRYEDLAMKPAEALVAILDYLELPSTPATVEAVLGRAAEEEPEAGAHRTSASLEQSIGRWREETGDSIGSLCEEVFGEALELFSYQRSAARAGPAAETASE